MIIVKCIKIYRDKHNRIIGYRLRDTKKDERDITANQLKQAMRDCKVNVVNLTLTRDNRILRKTCIIPLGTNELKFLKLKNTDKLMKDYDKYIHDDPCGYDFEWEVDWSILEDNCYKYNIKSIVGHKGSPATLWEPAEPAYVDIDFYEDVDKYMIKAYIEEWQRLNNLEQIHFRPEIRECLEEIAKDEYEDEYGDGEELYNNFEKRWCDEQDPGTY